MKQIVKCRNHKGKGRCVEDEDRARVVKDNGDLWGSLSNEKAREFITAKRIQRKKGASKEKANR